MGSSESNFILTLSCQDRIGIIHLITSFLLKKGCNIIESGQYTDPKSKLFFMRIEFSCENSDINNLKAVWEDFSRPLNSSWKLTAKNDLMNTIIIVSREGHCLNDILFRWKSGLLPLNIRAIISNHMDFYQLSASYNIPFHYIPISNQNRSEAESLQLKIIGDSDLVVLARYMQILSNDMCSHLNGRAINIHHSFLPSFKGAKPYHQAHQRGVKLIGATAHYVTPELDEGPIIEQDVSRVEHSKTANELANIGRDIESVVLARAVKWHSEHRVFINKDKTVIFK